VTKKHYRAQQTPNSGANKSAGRGGTADGRSRWRVGASSARMSIMWVRAAAPAARWARPGVPERQRRRDRCARRVQSERVAEEAWHLIEAVRGWAQRDVAGSRDRSGGDRVLRNRMPDLHSATPLHATHTTTSLAPRRVVEVLHRIGRDHAVAPPERSSDEPALSGGDDEGPTPSSRGRV
jgi:hypothetical protein